MWFSISGWIVLDDSLKLVLWLEVIELFLLSFVFLVLKLLVLLIIVY